MPFIDTEQGLDFDAKVVMALVRLSDSCRYCQSSPPFPRCYTRSQTGKVKLEHEIQNAVWVDCQDQSPPGDGSIL
jgi:hypothetical protein